MQLLQGISIGEVEFIPFMGLNVRRGFPDGPFSEADRYALRGKSQDMGVEEPNHAVIGVLRVLEEVRRVHHSRMPPRMGIGETFLGLTDFAVLVKSRRDFPFERCLRFTLRS